MVPKSWHLLSTEALEMAQPLLLLVSTILPMSEMAPTILFGIASANDQPHSGLVGLGGRVRSSLDRSGSNFHLKLLLSPIKMAVIRCVSALSLIGSRFRHRPSHFTLMAHERLSDAIFGQKKTLSDPANYLTKIYYYCLSDRQIVIPIFPYFSLLI